MTTQPLILVAGATGNTGSGLVPTLLAAGARVRALVRNPDKADALRAQGAEVVIADLGKPETLGPAVAGVDRIYLCLLNGPDQARHGRNLIGAARKAGRPYVVHHSAAGSGRSRIIRDAGEVEAELRNSGLAWTIIRPTFYLQNLLMAAPTVASAGAIYLPMKNGRMAMTDVRDIVDVGARLLLEGGHEGKTFSLTTPEAFGIADVAAELGRVLGRKVEYVDVPTAAARESMVAMGMLPWTVDGYMELFEGFADNWGNRTSNDIQTILGRPARDYRQFIADHREVFAAPVHA